MICFHVHKVDMLSNLFANWNPFKVGSEVVVLEINDEDIELVKDVKLTKSDLHYGTQLVGKEDQRIYKGNGSIIEGINNYGAYEILVQSADDLENGTAACFFVTSNKHRGASIFRSVTSTGKWGEHLTITWKYGETHPRLTYMCPPSADGPKQQAFKLAYKTVA
jgi:hypothetical protein